LAEGKTNASRNDVVRRDVPLVADEQHVPGHSKCVGPPFDRLPVRAVADEACDCVDAPLTEGAESKQDVADALDRGHAADPADHEPLLGNAEEPAQVVPGRAVARDTRVQTDAEPLARGRPC
jgi:hypothetical protein